MRECIRGAHCGQREAAREKGFQQVSAGWASVLPKSFVTTCVAEGVKNALQSPKFPSARKSIRSINKHTDFTDTIFIKRGAPVRPILRQVVEFPIARISRFFKKHRRALEISHFLTAQNEPQKNAFPLSPRRLGRLQLAVPTHFSGQENAPLTTF